MKEPKWNPDVPVETLLKWKERECMKLRKRVRKLEQTVERLRNNISMILGDADLKKEVKKEEVIRNLHKQLSVLSKKLHIAYEDREQLIAKLQQHDKQESL